MRGDVATGMAGVAIWMIVFWSGMWFVKHYRVIPRVPEPTRICLHGHEEWVSNTHVEKRWICEEWGQ